MKDQNGSRGNVCRTIKIEKIDVENMCANKFDVKCIFVFFGTDIFTPKAHVTLYSIHIFVN